MAGIGKLIKAGVKAVKKTKKAEKPKMSMKQYQKGIATRAKATLDKQIKSQKVELGKATDKTHIAQIKDTIKALEARRSKK